MFKILGLAKKAVLAPTKFALLASLGAISIYVLSLAVPGLWEVGSEAIASSTSWLQSAEDESMYAPELQMDPEKELELIKSVTQGIQPRFRRAQILIRKKQAELEFLKEKARLIEQRVQREGFDQSTGRQVLEELAAKISSNEKGSEKELRLFRGLRGPTWLAIKDKRKTLEDSLGALVTLQERVQLLNDRLNERRLQTLRFVPDVVERFGQKNRSHQGSDLRECERLLQDVHEDLFLTLHTLDPLLLESSQ